MEIEFKWAMPETDIENLIKSEWLSTNAFFKQKIHMVAHYYDTINGLFKANGCALRMRKENDREFCYIKARVKDDGALFVRKEFFIDTHSLEEGIVELRKNLELQRLLLNVDAKDLIELCVIEFDRVAYDVIVEDRNEFFKAEFVYDNGIAIRPGKQVDICELEFELLDGNENLFIEYANLLESNLKLQAIKTSKIARILNN